MTQQQKVNAHTRHLRALELRKAGVTYQKIADTLGFRSPQAAWKAVNTALKRTIREPAQKLIDVEAERLDSLLLAIWPKAQKGDGASIDRVLRIMSRRAELLGLDSPRRVAGTGTDGEIIIKVVREDRKPDATDDD